MSEKKIRNIKTDPLLDDDESQAKAPGQAKLAKAEVKPAEPTPRVSTPVAAEVKAAQVKADALAKFPKDTVAQTKYVLDKSEHVNFIIPFIEGETGDESIQINGYKLTIKKNVMVNIPIQVANLLAEKYRIQMEAGKDKRIDRASDVSEALS